MEKASMRLMVTSNFMIKSDDTTKSFFMGKGS